MATAPTATSDRGCVPCSSGQFTANANLAGCTAWHTCDPGHYVAAAGTSTADRVCSPCPSGQIQLDAGYTGGLVEVAPRMPVWAGRGAQVPGWYLLGMNAARRLGILEGLDCCGRHVWAEGREEQSCCGGGIETLVAICGDVAR